MVEREPVDQLETNVSFWDIATNTAAEDELVLQAAATLLICDVAGIEPDDDTQSELCTLLAVYVERRYGLPEPLLDEVLNRAEINLKLEEAL